MGISTKLHIVPPIPAEFTAEDAKENHILLFYKGLRLNPSPCRSEGCGFDPRRPRATQVVVTVEVINACVVFFMRIFKPCFSVLFSI
jgi:hypothetical protein